MPVLDMPAGNALPADEPASAPVRARRSHNRLQQVLDAAARVFAQRGFAAASVREIVQPIGMLPGSLYYHFPTKDDLLVAVYEEGVQRILADVDAAIARVDTPWKQLEAACVAHLQSILDQTDYSQVVIRIRPGDAAPVADRLTALRNRYEQRFAELIAALPEARPAQRSDLRLFLMGALNWSQTWYRDSGTLGPEQIARRLIRLLRAGMDPR
ncbi:MAG TPA: TetR/AcrR family transcriptional regulator [Burkholderiaceae bacterium]